MDGDQRPPEGSASGVAFGESYVESPPIPFPERDRHDPPPDAGGPPGPAYGRGPWGFGPPMPFPVRGPGGYNLPPLDERRGVAAVNNEAKSGGSCAACCCACALNTVWLLVAIVIVFGVYASETVQLGPNSSMLINPNHLLVDSITVVELDAVEGSILYGFHERPPLDVVVNWSEVHHVVLPRNTHKDWVYHLNKGSQISISFSFNSPSSTPIVLVIAKGKDDLDNWLKNPSKPRTVFSWHIIHENGSIQVPVSKSSAYYIAVGNLNSTAVEVQLYTRIKAFLYNTTEPYYKCIPLEGSCDFKLSFVGGNAGVLTSPGRKSDMADGDWSFRLSYGPRWTTYSIGLGITTVAVLVSYYIVTRCRSTEQEQRTAQLGDLGSERDPLLSFKDKEKYFKHALAGSVRARKPVKAKENSKGDKCEICLDGHKDCFFIPCEDSVACSECAKRIVNGSGSCPVCHRQVEDVVKIYTV